MYRVASPYRTRLIRRDSPPPPPHSALLPLCSPTAPLCSPTAPLGGLSNRSARAVTHRCITDDHHRLGRGNQAFSDTWGQQTPIRGRDPRTAGPASSPAAAAT